MKNKIIKSVHFNTKNKDDEYMLKAISKRNFSGYIKKLILADLKEKELLKAQSSDFIEGVEVAEEAPKKEKQPLTAAEKMALMKERLKKPSDTPGPKMFN